MRGQAWPDFRSTADLQFGVDEVLVAKAQQLGKFVNEIILVLVEPAIGIYNLPDHLNDLDLLFSWIILVDQIGKLPQVDTAVQFFLW